MTNPKWGRKRICHACGAMFYDMRRNPIVCPKCDTKFDPEAILKSRRARVPAAKEAAPKAVAPRTVAPEKAEAEDQVEAGPEKDQSEIEKDESEVEKAESEIEKDATESDKEETLLEDPSGLTEDEDDVAEVREHLDKDEPSS